MATRAAWLTSVRVAMVGCFVVTIYDADADLPMSEISLGQLLKLSYDT